MRAISSRHAHPRRRRLIKTTTIQVFLLHPEKQLLSLLEDTVSVIVKIVRRDFFQSLRAFYAHRNNNI